MNASESALFRSGSLAAGQIRDASIAAPKLGVEAARFLLGLAERRVIVNGVYVYGVAKAPAAQ